MRGFFSSLSSTSRTAYSDTCRPMRSNRFSTWPRSSSVTSRFRPLTSIRTLHSSRLGGRLNVILRRRGPPANPLAGSRRCGEGDRGDAGGSRLAEGLGAGSEGGARRRYVIDQDRPIRRRRDRPDPWWIREPLGTASPYLSRALGTCEARHEGQTRSFRERRGQRLRGVEATSTAAKRSGRNGDDRSFQQARRRATRNERRRLLGERNPRTELERADQVTRDPVVRSGRPNLVESGHRGPDWRQAAQAGLAAIAHPSAQLTSSAANRTRGRRNQGKDLLQHPMIVP